MLFSSHLLLLDRPRTERRVLLVAKPSDDEVWERLLKIRDELGKGWQNEKSAVEILSEMRR